MKDNKAKAAANMALGWCPCGSELNQDCECFGVFRLSVVQGLAKPERVRTRPPEPVPDSPVVLEMTS